MSISTGSISSYCSCSSYSTSALKHNQIEGWRQEIYDKINVYEGDLESYLTNFVPSRTPCTLQLPDESLSSSWKPEKGKEVESYGPLINIFNALVADFPADKKLSFYSSHSQKIPFPFSAFAERHHKSSPDIVVSFPGDTLPATMHRLQWSRFSMVIEAKDVPEKDPFVQINTMSNADTLAQLAVNARSLMFAHGFLATFVLGIYGDNVRIARFDHSCAVASRPFSLKSEEGLRAVQDFFWNFVHPWEGGPGAVVGSDTTIRKLTDADHTWVRNRLGDEAKEMLQGVDLREGRWAKVWDDDEPQSWKPYIMFKLIDINARLFSRSTMVWLSIEDTRIDDADDGTDSNTEVHLRVIKESWRQLVRTPEKWFYERLNATIPEDKWCGLPNVMHGGDLGFRDVKRWRAACAGLPWSGDDGLLERKSTVSATSPATSETSTRPPSLFSSAPSASSTFGDLSDDDDASSSSQGSSGIPEGKPPYPMHETWSWRLSRGAEHEPKERSHVRFVIDTVGRPLSQFRSTKELVTAIRDAIKGHQLAMEYGGILHRDVSTGNILIVDQPRQHRTKGVLHDFDYSSMTAVPPAEAKATASSDPPPLRLLELEEEFENVAQFKERTGTYYFIALQLLEPAYKEVCHDARHDLESFYWVLLWIVLRYTKYVHVDPTGCSEVFVYGDDKAAASAKRAWLTRPEALNIPDNLPLTILLAAFESLVRKANRKEAPDEPARIPLTYATVLEIFDAALARTDWPVGDEAIPFRLPEERTQTVFLGEVKIGTGKRRNKKRRMGDDDLVEEGSGLVSGSTTLHSSTSAVSKRPKKEHTPLGIRSAPVVSSDRVASRTSRGARSARKTSGRSTQVSGS
ncbi:hypothetical protein OH77DRAFT_1413043 [Trametes cingulata]|nr:hypothetical protein OH77DRAFT_1413043 [Trametes cingulata]